MTPELSKPDATDTETYQGRTPEELAKELRESDDDDLNHWGRSLESYLDE